MAENGVYYAELMPYNKMAGGKYATVQKKYTPGFDETVDVNPQTEIFRKFNIETKIL